MWDGTHCWGPITVTAGARGKIWSEWDHWLICILKNKDEFTDPLPFIDLYFNKIQPDENCASFSLVPAFQ